MKYAISFIIGISIGISIGWYCGYACPAARHQRELLEQDRYISDHLPNVESNLAYINKQREESFNAAKPFAKYPAQTALAALKDLDRNDLESARWKLVAAVAVYYRGHSRDGDTNLLANIATFATKDTVLSNAIYGKFP